MPLILLRLILLRLLPVLLWGHPDALHSVPAGSRPVLQYRGGHGGSTWLILRPWACLPPVRLTTLTRLGLHALLGLHPLLRLDARHGLYALLPGRLPLLGRCLVRGGPGPLSGRSRPRRAALLSMGQRGRLPVHHRLGSPLVLGDHRCGVDGRRCR